MNLVDSCGWLEYFADGPLADFYAPAIEDTAFNLVPALRLGSPIAYKYFSC
jgi:toxin FitB